MSIDIKILHASSKSQTMMNSLERIEEGIRIGADRITRFPCNCTFSHASGGFERRLTRCRKDENREILKINEFG
jgi:hypothetical protein